LANTPSDADATANLSNRTTPKLAGGRRGTTPKNALELWAGGILYTHTCYKDRDVIIPLEKVFAAERRLYREIFSTRVKNSLACLLAPAEEEYRKFEFFNLTKISPLLRGSIRSLQIYNE